MPFFGLYSLFKADWATLLHNMLSHAYDGECMNFKINDEMENDLPEGHYHILTNNKLLSCTHVWGIVSLCIKEYHKHKY